MGHVGDIEGCKDRCWMGGQGDYLPVSPEEASISIEVGR